MKPDELTFLDRPELDRPRMLLGFDGWMDGGDVSTAAVGYIARAVDARPLAEIDPDSFRIYNMPGSMEIAALFRPHAKIDEGLVSEYDHTVGRFLAGADQRLIVFEGVEPNLRWPAYAECILHVAERFGVERMVFIGSVAGLVPHTRQPRMSASASDAAVLDRLAEYGIRLSDYEGPAHFVTLLTRMAAERGIEMIALATEIPAYVQGTNPICIESVVRRLAGMLELRISHDDLRRRSETFERKLNEVVRQKPELQEFISRMESDYDNELFDTELGDLKDWLEQQGIRLD